MISDVIDINSLIKYDAQHTNIGVDVIKRDLMYLQNVVYRSTFSNIIISHICNQAEHLIDFGFTSNQLLDLYHFTKNSYNSLLTKDVNDD